MRLVVKYEPQNTSDIDFIIKKSLGEKTNKDM